MTLKTLNRNSNNNTNNKNYQKIHTNSHNAGVQTGYRDKKLVKKIILIMLEDRWTKILNLRKQKNGRKAGKTYIDLGYKNGERFCRSLSRAWMLSKRNYFKTVHIPKCCKGAQIGLCVRSRGEFSNEWLGHTDESHPFLRGMKITLMRLQANNHDYGKLKEFNSSDPTSTKKVSITFLKCSSLETTKEFKTKLTTVGMYGR